MTNHKKTNKLNMENLHNLNIYNRSLIEACPDPLLAINCEGKITDVNRAMEKITGFSRQELNGTAFSDYFSEPDKAHNNFLNFVTLKM